MTYSHRNGETEPPTVKGWYWLRHLRGKTYVPGQPFVFLAKKKYGKVLFIVDFDMPVADIHGKWWGPVVPPWEGSE